MQGLARFSLVAVIVLAAILLGSWAYLVARYGGVSEYLASDDAPHYWQPSHSSAHDDPESGENTGGSLAERVAGEVKAGTSHPEEQPRFDEPKPRESGPAVPDSTSGDKEDAVAAQLDEFFDKPEIEVGDKKYAWQSGSPSNGPFFARTRPDSPADRTDYLDKNALDAMEKQGVFRATLPAELEKNGRYFIRGMVRDNVTQKPIPNAVVALDASVSGSSPAMRAVSNEEGEFAMSVTASVRSELVARRKPLNFRAFADGYTLSQPLKSREAQEVQSDANGRYVIDLSRSRGLRVRVRIGNPAPVSDRVRVWVEQTNDAGGCLYDDQLFMSVAAPAQGDIVFRLPDRMTGNVRVAACGNGWASREIFETDKAAYGIISTSISLEPTSTFKLSGHVSLALVLAGVKTLKSRDVRAARVESTDLRGLTYTDSKGGFEAFAPYTGASTGNHATVWYATLGGSIVTFSLDQLDDKSESPAKLSIGGTLPGGPWSIEATQQAWVYLIPPAGDEKLWSDESMLLVGYVNELKRWEEANFVGVAGSLENGRHFRGVPDRLGTEFYLVSSNLYSGDENELRRVAEACYRIDRRSLADFEAAWKQSRKPFVPWPQCALKLERIR